MIDSFLGGGTSDSTIYMDSRVNIQYIRSGLFRNPSPQHAVTHTHTSHLLVAVRRQTALRSPRFWFSLPTSPDQSDYALEVTIYGVLQGRKQDEWRRLHEFHTVPDGFGRGCLCFFVVFLCVFLPRTVVVFVAAFAILLSCYTIESADALDAAVWPRNLGFALL